MPSTARMQSSNSSIVLRPNISLKSWSLRLRMPRSQSSMSASTTTPARCQSRIAPSHSGAARLLDDDDVVVGHVGERQLAVDAAVDEAGRSAARRRSRSSRRPARGRAARSGTRPAPLLPRDMNSVFGISITASPEPSGTGLRRPTARACAPCDSRVQRSISGVGLAAEEALVVHGDDRRLVDALEAGLEDAQAVVDVLVAEPVALVVEADLVERLPADELQRGGHEAAASVASASGRLAGP